jgi:thiosulfate dehydrogenase [quinone] large subunit
VAEHDNATLDWVAPVADLASTVAPLTAVVVAAAQLFVGLSFLTNRRFGAALVMGSLLNLAFVAIGAVNPSAFYLIGQGAMALWLIGTQRPTEAVSRGLRFGVAIGVALAAISLPFLETVHPATVIDDPAAMLATLGGLAALAGELTHRALFNRSLP